MAVAAEGVSENKINSKLSNYKIYGFGGQNKLDISIIRFCGL